MKITERDTKSDVAVELELDSVGKAAFVGVANAAPILCRELIDAGHAMAELAENMSTTDLKKNAVFSISDTVSDLDTLSSQTSDPDIRDAFDNAIVKLRRIERRRGRIRDGSRGDDVSKGAASIDVVLVKSQEDDEQRTVLGIVLEPDVVDSQNDTYDADEVRKTAWLWMERYQNFGLMHKQIRQDILPLESYLAPTDFDVGGQHVRKGTWLIRSRVLDDTVWKRVKSGELTGYSIGGSAKRTREKR